MRARHVLITIATLLLLLAVILPVFSELTGGSGREPWASVRYLRTNPSSDQVGVIVNTLPIGLAFAPDTDADLAGIAAQVKGFAWMPDGESVVLAVSDSLSSTDPIRLVLYDIETRTEEDLPLSIPPITLAGPDSMDISADGRSLLLAAQEPSQFVEPSSVWRVDLESGDAGIELEGTTDRRYSSPRFLNDRGGLVFVEAVESPGGDEVWVSARMSRDDDPQRLSVPGHRFSDVTVSPDSRRVLYAGFPGNARSERALWSIDLDTKEAERVLTDVGRYPSVSADGSRVCWLNTGLGRSSAAVACERLPD